jgi:hypothetical protein
MCALRMMTYEEKVLKKMSIEPRVEGNIFQLPSGASHHVNENILNH